MKELEKHSPRVVDETQPHILIVDDEISMGEFLSILLKKEGYRITAFSDPEKAVKTLEKGLFDLVISDLSMPGMDGMELLRRIKSVTPETAVIIMTAYATPENAIEAMKSGAFDYITKPFNNDAIKLTVWKALQASQLTRENLLLKRQMKGEHRFGGIVGTSSAMREVFELVQVVKNNKSNVLIVGESGTGKELVAREIHYQGDLADRPFVTVNCGAIPETLIESELFGHVKGSFTGAISNRVGLFRSAHGGTIFLDEIGELTLSTQVKLLRVLQTKIVRPIGSSEDQAVDVRIVAATNRELETMVRENTFREDLYFRLNVIQIRMPPLRDRREDIPPLVQVFLKRINQEMGKEVRKVSQEAMDLLMTYSYPGNIRELENIVERSVALEKNQVLLAESLPENVRNQAMGFAIRSSSADGKMTLPKEGMDLEAYVDGIEKSLLIQALDACGGVKTEAAKLLKLSFRSLRYRLEKHGL